ncbi:uncharacterized protein EI90DRAFT_3124374 [Cantharellus anzutake]|uniref:uncharacterized protein n=1 Tax=Cantharellus anzutake TaxID=1750568 RepID=UPI001908C092|nr:uncharacterized protein EI90DRAFT_3124374 [Cantharellus anzutake]KAF8330341.1 hypothetical protein EI90DRAFT_3124374 [Cantharellus anzutake]
MDGHALAVMEAVESWDWPLTYRIQASGDQGSKFKSIIPKLLSGFIAESQALGGTLVDHFWVVLGQCHPRLEENITILRDTKFSSPLHSETMLFEGVNRETNSVLVMNPSGRKSRSSTPPSVNELIAKDTDELLQMAASEGLGTRKQAALEALIFKRDGQSCPLTGVPFDPEYGVDPILAHVIPNSVHNKPETIKCIAMLAGTAVCDLVLEQLNGPGNLMLIQSDAHTAYDNIRWGIEARNENGMVKYIYRRVPYSTAKGPGFIRLCDGDQVAFGGGPEAARLGSGPNPSLCNLRLAVARVLRMSGAADIITKMIDDGNDSDFPHIYIASPAFCSILTVRLQLAGGVLLTFIHDRNLVELCPRLSRYPLDESVFPRSSSDLFTVTPYPISAVKYVIYLSCLGATPDTSFV